MKLIQNYLLLGWFLAATISLQGCASLKSVSYSQVPKNRSNPIYAENSTWAIFGIFFSNSFVDKAIDDLTDQCSNGKISGVYTKYEDRSYFFWKTRTVRAQAFCSSRANHSKRPRKG